MILYVNGDSHAAAAEAVNTFAFAEDDKRFFYMGRAPHPENLSASWGRTLAMALKYTLKCDAESASSNDRIIRTTKHWLEKNPRKDQFLIIQWSTWEREEWLIDDVWYQVNASGIDSVPEDHQQRYKEFVMSVDWAKKTQQAHEKIWQFHEELVNQGRPHLFFNGDNHFGKLPESQRKDWGMCYIDPYDPRSTYSRWLKDQGYQTVSPTSYHYGREAHAAWCRHLMDYLRIHNLI